MATEPGMKLTATIDEAGLNQALIRLAHFVPSSKREFIWRSVLRKALSLNRKRVKAQKNLDGSSFAARKDGSGVKLLRRLAWEKNAKGRSQYKFLVGPKGAKATHLNPLAAKHHYGGTTVFSVRDNARQERHRQRKLGQVARGEKRISASGSRFLDNEAPCSKRQAHMIKQYYKFKWLVLEPSEGSDQELKKKRGTKRRKGRKPRNAVPGSVRNIRKAFNVYQAGGMLRAYREHNGIPTKTTWNIKLAPRDVLGVSQSDGQILLEYFTRLIAKYGNNAGWLIR